MLIIAHNMRELNFPALMEIYREGNEENGAEQWPEEPPFRQVQLAEEGFRDYLRSSFFPAGGIYYLWEAEGRPVSALRLEAYKDGLLLEALETAPEARRQGYATDLMVAVLALHGGTPIYSHVHKKNEPSMAVHCRCGFQRIAETAAYIDGSVNSLCCTLRYIGENPCQET